MYMKEKTKRALISVFVAFIVGFLGVNVLFGIMGIDNLSFGLIATGILAWGIFDIWMKKKPSKN